MRRFPRCLSPVRAGEIGPSGRYAGSGACPPRPPGRDRTAARRALCTGQCRTRQTAAGAATLAISAPGWRLCAPAGDPRPDVRELCTANREYRQSLGERRRLLGAARSSHRSPLGEPRHRATDRAGSFSPREAPPRAAGRAPRPGCTSQHRGGSQLPWTTLRSSAVIASSVTDRWVVDGGLGGLVGGGAERHRRGARGSRRRRPRPACGRWAPLPRDAVGDVLDRVDHLAVAADQQPEVVALGGRRGFLRRPPRRARWASMPVLVEDPLEHVLHA